MHTQNSTQNSSLTQSDAALAQLVLAGDQGAFEMLVKRYHTPLFNFICHFLGDYDLASDVLQQVWNLRKRSLFANCGYVVATFDFWDALSLSWTAGAALPSEDRCHLPQRLVLCGRGRLARAAALPSD